MHYKSALSSVSAVEHKREVTYINLSKMKLMELLNKGVGVFSRVVSIIHPPHTSHSTTL